MLMALFTVLIVFCIFTAFEAVSCLYLVSLSLSPSRPLSTSHLLRRLEYVQTLPLFTIKAFHWTSSDAGLTFLAPSLPNLLSPLVGKELNAYGTRAPTALVCIMLGLCLIFFRLTKRNDLGHQIILAVLLTLTDFARIVVQIDTMTEMGFAVDGFEARDPGAFRETCTMAQA